MSSSRGARMSAALPLLAVAALALLAAATTATAQAQGAGPTYYIAADEIQWNYAPSGLNLCNGEEFEGNTKLWTQLGVGSVFTKAQYRQYTDSSFQTLLPRPPQDEHTGNLGPVMRASVGQVLTVVLRNNLAFPINLLPAGVQAADAAGADGDAAAVLSPEVQPGQVATYRFAIPDSMGPSELEPTAKLWLYRSTVDFNIDANAGLVGPLLISNTPEVNTGDVAGGQERDIITVLQVLDENISPYYEVNLANRTAAEFGLTEEGLEEGNLKHGINGYLYCNAPGMQMSQGEKVRWHMASVGSATDMHNLHLHGNTFLNNGHRADHLSMIPGTARSLQFSTDNAGFWLMHCHVADHINAGMKAMYFVKQAADKIDVPLLSGVKTDGSGTVRRYFIEAEESEWDYAPQGGDVCSGSVTEWTPEQAVFNVAGEYSLGSKFAKGQYVEYTDDTFTTKKEVSPNDAYLGFLGPTLRAEVGDTIEVVFKNSMRFPATMHPHGVAYLKSSEGSPYFDGTLGADRADDSIAPGGTYTYTWQVPETSGPGPNDPSTLVWMYHSHTKEVEDVYAGLVGAIVIGRKGEVKEDLTAKDVDREVVLFFMVVNEINSIYATLNANALGFTSMDAWGTVAGSVFDSTTESDQAMAIQQEQMQALLTGSSNATGTGATTGAAAAAPAPAVETAAAPATAQAAVGGAGRRLMEMVMGSSSDAPMLQHAINGFTFCNNPDLRFTQGDRVRFHIMALGTEVDLHTPNFVGESLQMDGQTMPAAGMTAGAMHSVDVVMANPGNAVVQCRVAAHIAAGMRALIRVDPSEDLAAAAATQAAALAAATATKRYFIAAEEVQWNYAPLGKDGCTDAAFGPDAQAFTAKTNESIGSVFTKAQYKQYTDATFTKLVEQPASHGLLGPTLLIEVGQALELVFRNSLDFPANIQLDGGLQLLSGPAGSGVEDAAGGQRFEAPVAPGTTATYVYLVPESAGPGPDDLSTVANAYTSSVDLEAHPNAGLVGVLVVAAPGTLSASGVPAGVDAMLPLMFITTDEGASPYLERNVAAAGLSVAGTFAPAFEASNLKHAINGYLYCNLPGLAAPRGSTLRLLLVGMGGEGDMHSPAFTSQVLRGQSAAYQTAELLTGVTRVADVKMEQEGQWPVYCAVQEHYDAGMRATLVVTQP